MQLSPRYNFRYPELTDQVSAFPPDVAAQNALLLDQVIGSLADNTTAALAGKAPTSHTHTMGQVTGLDAALAGKAAASTLDARVPSNMALRLDTTVGTRIFAGNTMIYGDTGWRNITALLQLENMVISEGGFLAIRREQNLVYLKIRGQLTKVDSRNYGLLVNGLTTHFTPPYRIRLQPPKMPNPEAHFDVIPASNAIGYYSFLGNSWGEPLIETMMTWDVSGRPFPTTYPGPPL